MNEDGAYQGAGFSGTRVGQPDPGQLGTAHHDVPPVAAPSSACPSCGSQLYRFPDGQVWCTRCKAAIGTVAERERAGGGFTLLGVIVGIVLILGGLWVAGVFDTALAPYGLNFGTCVEMYADGAIYCGDDIPAGFYNFD